MMKILTWNINGLRSVKKDKCLERLFDSLDADIICLQETKLTREMLEEQTAIVEGYNAYFSFSKVRSGYSGVATFCRNHLTPVKAEDKIHLPDKLSDYDEITEENCLTDEDIESLNAEGRSVLTEHVDTDGNHVVIINLYCPRADLENTERTQFKLKFYSLVEKKCKSLIKEKKHVIVLGDFNVSHKLIDHCDPHDPEIFDSNPSRQWANTFIWDPRIDEPNANTSHPFSGETQRIITDLYDETYKESKAEGKTQNTKFIDTFRYFHPFQESAFTCWSTLTGARQTNYGTRIDYIFSSETFFKKEFVNCVIRPDIEGSDHCPVIARLKSTFRNGGKPPALCTKYMPEFSGKQQKLKDFFKKSKVNTNLGGVNENEKIKRSSCNEAQLKVSEKRPAQSHLKSQPKRLKTNSGSSQGKIFQFFEKKDAKSKANNDKHQNCESVDFGNGKVVPDRLGNTNQRQKDLAIVEESPKADHQQRIHDIELRSFSSTVPTTSQHSTSLVNLDENSTPTSSQNSSQTNEEKQVDSQIQTKEQRNSQENTADVVASWKSILKGLPPPPLCSGHKEPCVLRTVKNKGPNHGKRFYCCARPQGHSTNKEARCNYFSWVKK